MAVQPSTLSYPAQSNTIRLAVWNAMANGDSGAPFGWPDWADRSIQVQGTFGAGGTVVFEGSNDGVTYATLTDQNGNAMSYTAATVKQCTEAPLWVRPRVTGGDGTTSIVVSLLARRLYQLY